MTHGETTEESCLQRADIGAYLDGELSSGEELALELHVAHCKKCLAELNAQKRVLSALDCARDHKSEIELPENFAKVVAVRAESGVSGLRSKKERFRAFWLCAALLVIAGLGQAAGKIDLLSNLIHLGEKSLAVLNFAGHLIYNLAVGVTIILRSLGGQLVFNSALTILIAVIVFAFSAAVLSNLIFRSNRQ